MRSNRITVDHVVIGVIAPILALALLASCNKNPVGPDSPTTDNVKPQPVVGTTDHQVPVAGEPFPLHIWLTEVSPAQGSTLQVGQNAFVRFTCGGPGGYSAIIGAELMAGEYIAETVQNGNPVKVGRIGGALYHVGDKCDTTAGAGFIIKETAPDVTHVLFQVWVAKGAGLPDQSLLPVTFQEPLNWKAPVK